MPAAAPLPGQPLDLSWRLHWQGTQQQLPPSGWAVQARRGKGWAVLANGDLQFVIDFDGPALRAALPGAAPRPPRWLLPALAHASRKHARGRTPAAAGACSCA